MKLTEAQSEALNELSTIDGDGWIKTRWLSGSSEARSSRNLHSLVMLRLVEKTRPGLARGERPQRQRQYRWRITPAGRAALNQEKGGG